MLSAPKLLTEESTENMALVIIKQAAKAAAPTMTKYLCEMATFIFVCVVRFEPD